VNINQRKLTREQVKQIRYEYLPNKVSSAILGRKYGVSPATIHKVVTNYTYKEFLDEN
jgi:hypothetical protein